MTDSRPPPRRPPEREFTQKIRYCKGCHNEIHPDVPRCLVCGTRNVPTDQLPAMEDPLAKKELPASEPPAPKPEPAEPPAPAQPAPDSTKK